MTRKTNLVPQTMSYRQLANRHLRSRITRRPTIIEYRPKAMHIRSTRSLHIRIILTTMVRRRHLDTAFSLIMTETRASQISVTPMILNLQVSNKITVRLQNQYRRSTNLHPLHRSRRISQAIGTNLNHLSQVTLMVGQQY